MAGDNLKWSIDYYKENYKTCNEILADAENYVKVPLIKDSNIHCFKDGDLVRYVGMVQEILNPVCFSEVHHNNIRDEAQKSGPLNDLDMSEHLERLMVNDKHLREWGVYFLIPIQHQSQWVENYWEKPDETQVNAHTSGEGRKRQAPEGDESDLSYENQPKCLKSEPGPVPHQERNGNIMDALDMYYPLHKRNGLPCILKYSNDDKNDILMNERIEVVGFLGLEPEHESFGEADEGACNLPTSIVPRLHGIACRKLKHINPLLSYNVNISEIIATAETVRSDLHLVLSQILNGDPFAADYVICYLLSRVFSRAMKMPVGHLSVNISNIKEGSFPRRFHRLIDSLVTNSHYLPLSIENLNEKEFHPKKNYDCGRLISGRLQFADATHLVVDETVLKEGQLNEFGTTNFCGLEALLIRQEVDYNFTFYSIPFMVDVPVLILSEGSALLRAKILLKMNPFSDEESINEAFDAADLFLRGKVVEDIRKYLTGLRMEEFNITEELAERISNDFVRMRQVDRTFSGDDFDTVLTVARLMALSYGRTSLTADDWNRAVEMEKERKMRNIPRR